LLLRLSVQPVERVKVQVIYNQLWDVNMNNNINTVTIRSKNNIFEFHFQSNWLISINETIKCKTEGTHADLTTFDRTRLLEKEMN